MVVTLTLPLLTINNNTFIPPQDGGDDGRACDGGRGDGGRECAPAEHEAQGLRMVGKY